MRLTGRIVNGRVEVESEDALPEGAEVTLLIAEDEVLTEEDDEELWQRSLAVERGEFIGSDELLSELRARRPR